MGDRSICYARSGIRWTIMRISIALRWTVCSLILLLGLQPGVVDAHAILIDSAPAHGAVLDTSPPTIVMHFNVRLEQALARVNLIALRKELVRLDVTAGSTDDRLVVHVPPLSAGVYTVMYKVLAKDGHVSEGRLQFTVRGH